MATTTCSCCGESVEQAVQLHSHKEIQICYQCLDWLNMRRDKKVGAHGGGWQVAGFEPIFTVCDVPRSTDHYDKLGFEIGHHDETYAFAHRDRDLTIHLTLADKPVPSKLYLHCDDADELAESWTRGPWTRGLRLRQTGRHAHRPRREPHSVRLTDPPIIQI